MAKFVVLLKAKRKGELSEPLLFEHVEHLKAQHQVGTLVLCGPFVDDEGALQIIEAETLDGARQVVDADPFVAEGYYRDVEVHELLEANEENNWLMGHPQTAANLGLKEA